MFTGLVQATGTVSGLEGGRLRVEADPPLELREGDSVAVSGVCLTATEVNGGSFAADVVAETLGRSSLGGLGPGDRVNLGAIAVDGVSLTVAEVDDDVFAVALIPETLERTTLGGLEPGHPVNLEVDVLAKYVEKLVRRGAPA